MFTFFEGVNIRGKYSFVIYDCSLFRNEWAVFFCREWGGNMGCHLAISSKNEKVGKESHVAIMLLLLGNGEI